MRDGPPNAQVVVIGAGPVGIAAAVACQRRGLSTLLVDRGCLCAAMHRYPRHMQFFSTAANLEIAGIPFACVGAKPSRDEALEYYRSVAESAALDCRLYHCVERLSGNLEQGFILEGSVHNQPFQLHADRVVLATGFFQQAVTLGIPGESLPQVAHYFDDGHRYFGQDLVIVGAANSAVIAALECWRRGARVSMVHRGSDFNPCVKYWLSPDIRNRLAEGAITMHWNSQLQRIDHRQVTISSAGTQRTLPADAVLLLTGYRANHQWLESLGITLDQHHAPQVSIAFESRSRPGVYLIGCALCGDHTGDIFIENGRHHAEQAAAAIAEQLA